MTLSPCRTLQNVTHTQKCVPCREYAKPNRCVFKCFAKVSKPKEEDLKPTGKAFQLLGPATYEGTLKYGVPQGSVLGPLLFILYTSDVISIAASLGVGTHSYADDSQLYLHCLAVDQRSAALRLAECIERVEGWMKSNRLKLNSDKTQFM